MGKLSILYIAPSIAVPSFHGGSTHVLELSRNLVKLGCEVTVLARRLPAQPQSEVLDGIKIFRVWRGIFKPIVTDNLEKININQNNKFRLLEKIYFNTIYVTFISSIALYLANRGNVDVIMERGDSYGAGGLVSLITSIPLVTEIRDVYQPKISLIVAKKLLVYDTSILKDKRFLYKTTTMYGGVDIERFRPMNKMEIKASLGLSNKFVIGYSGSFAKSHRIDTLAIIAKRLIKKYGSNIHFLVVGPFNPSFLKILDSLGLRRHFLLSGPIHHEELPKYLNAMDVGLALYNPTLVAGPPYKVYEYNACGVPAITTDTIYSRKIIRNNFNGFLVNDVGDTVNKLSLLIENPCLLHEMSINARKIAETFSWKEEAKRIFKLLKAICDK
jgi:glycosyltransferase involved in cell wall biosynthesis